ncbi:MAG: triose-phosphate isomerase [Gammaproteobacteria bacterium]|nr:triose-phosphate isomerase [Gammaproteobacteria bacterium]
MRQKLVVGNWKMHGSRGQIQSLVAGLVNGFEKRECTVEIGICPTNIHLEQVGKLLATGKNSIKLGAQNTYFEEKGAFTGEVSALMLADMGVELVIIGHSERRRLFAETDGLIAAKFKAIQANGMMPILCVGESLEERKQGITNQIVLAQLDSVINATGIAAFTNAAIAYEPIWAIGTGQTATPEQAQEVHCQIRGHLASSDAIIAEGVRIIYGGSVNSSNAGELFSQPDIDGGLVGGASLKAEEFISICKSAD